MRFRTARGLVPCPLWGVTQVKEAEVARSDQPRMLDTRSRPRLVLNVLINYSKFTGHPPKRGRRFTYIFAVVTDCLVVPMYSRLRGSVIQLIPTKPLPNVE
jgi:hypothetical protein